jgi:hypothetical protein
VGYCASLAIALIEGKELPPNVTFQSENWDESYTSGFLLVEFNKLYPLPFNRSYGELWMGCMWDPEDGTGVISAIFTDIDVVEAEYNLVGIYTIPVIKRIDGKIMTAYAEQDIIVGEGSDTLLRISMTKPEYNKEIERIGIEPEEDVFAAVQQNVWILEVDLNQTPEQVYDDRYIIYGGGQIVEARGETGGIIYHSLIGAELDLLTCGRNPVSGTGFIQNLKAGTELDLGHILLDFNENCDGRAFVNLGLGKYLRFNQQYIDLEL